MIQKDTNTLAPALPAIAVDETPQNFGRCGLKMALWVFTCNLGVLGLCLSRYNIDKLADFGAETGLRH